MVLTRRQHEILFAADHEHDRGFLALHEFLDDDFIARAPEDLRFHHIAQSRFSLGVIHRNDDTLPCRQTRGFNNNGERLLTDVGQRWFQGSEGLSGRGGNLMAK